MEEKKKQPEIVNVELSDIMGEGSGMSFEVIETKTKDDKKEDKKD